ncbi:FAD-dependent oxidoreductase [Candidatus Berkelbacteria bacterium]|nr:FAD-dependent oxidoreductase [Candidatus Berkelbacteria bacterium]
MDDLLIIGGSAVATAAGIYAARDRVNLRVVSTDWGGEVATSGEIENYPGFVHTDGIALADEFLKHLKANGVEPEIGVTIEAIAKNPDGSFTAKGKKNGTEVSYQAKAVIIGTGVHPRELSVPGEKEFRNKGVSYCSVCDIPLFKGKTVAVIGGGNTALESILMATKIASKVYSININAELTGEAVYIEQVKKLPNVELIINAKTTEIIGDKFVTGIKYADTQTNETKALSGINGIFVHVGMIPNSDFIKSFGVKLNEYREIEVDSNCQTNVPGLFAAGDVTNIPYKQIAVATGQGVCAALSAISYLRKLT